MKSIFKEKDVQHMVVLLGTLSILSGCANLHTIDRTTTLPSTTGQGKAIHLDIQQRLLIVNAVGTYCAEPSPDALAAFAAAAGLGASAPAKGALSASSSTSSTAASIGLRTQSITLMRDALYRMCEAYGNGQLSKAQVVTLLSRSQDLTAVVLATEQLTGTVAAQQAALSSSASADTTSVMTATSKLLEAAIKQQERAEDRLEQVVQRKGEAQAKKKEAEDELAAAKMDASNNSDDNVAGQKARARLKKAESDLEAVNRSVVSTEEIRVLREKTLEVATERVESLQKALDSAATSATTSSSGSAALFGGGDRNRLNDQSTQAIATAVSSMVNNVLNKPYVLEYCMAIMTTENKTESKYDDGQDRSLCRTVVSNAIIVDQDRIAKASMEDIFAERDTTMECVKKWLKADKDKNKVRLDQWRQQNAKDIDHVFFVFGKGAKVYRSAAINDLSISCT
jgi:hypothetical protein